MASVAAMGLPAVLRARSANERLNIARIATATFLSEIAPPWLRRPASFLAAIPSVVSGFWGLLFYRPICSKGSPCSAV
jgi:hypothetical protein